MGQESKYIWMNGELVPFEKATVPFLAPLCHYGLGVFEGIRAYKTPKGTAVFRLNEHIRRLINSAHSIGFPAIPYSHAELVAAVCKTIAANGFEECYIRPLVYLSDGSMGLMAHVGTVGVGIATWDMGRYLGEAALEKGVRANVSSFTRLHPNVLLTKTKAAGNYVNSALAKSESVRLGFEEAILLDTQGYVSECTGENIFVVRNETIITPPTTTILEGITRSTLLTLAEEAGVKVVEQQITRDQLYIADEVFICGTAAEVIGLSEIDFRVIGTGKTGTITRKMQKAYHAAIHGEDAHADEWLTKVNG
jgi:branched-chain amino acid aminotransferase